MHQSTTQQPLCAPPTEISSANGCTYTVPAASDANCLVVCFSICPGNERGVLGYTGRGTWAPHTMPVAVVSTHFALGCAEQEPNHSMPWTAHEHVHAEYVKLTRHKQLSDAAVLPGGSSSSSKAILLTVPASVGGCFDVTAHLLLLLLMLCMVPCPLLCMYSRTMAATEVSSVCWTSLLHGL